MQVVMSNPILLYRVVNSLIERNSIPCLERVNGMKVTVIGEDFSYKEYMMKGGDPCVNDNWKESFNIQSVGNSIGHATVEDVVEGVIENSQLNEMFPKSSEGFRVTFTNLNTTFTKIYGDRWIITNSTL